METVETLLLYFVDESTFNRLNSRELTSLIDEIGLHLSKLDGTIRYELLNSLYYNKKSNGYSSLLHICFCRMINDDSLKYTLWRTVYIFCEFGLNPMNVNYLAANQIMFRNSMKESLNLLLEIQDENEMKEMKIQIRNLKSQQHSIPSSVEYNIGEINDVFAGEVDNIIYQQQQQQHVQQKTQRISPFHCKLKTEPLSWIDLQLNMTDNDDINHITKRNIIEVLSYCGNYKYKCNNYYSPAIFTIYVNLHSLSSCLTILGNAFISFKQFTPNMLTFALCKLSKSKILSMVDNISYYDHNKMNKCQISIKKSIDILRHSINASFKQLSDHDKRVSNYNYLCYLYLIKSFYNKFKNESLNRFNMNGNDSARRRVQLNNKIFPILQSYTFEDMTYFGSDVIGENTENKWICIWFDCVVSCHSIYGEKWIHWIQKNILKTLNASQKEYLAQYLANQGQTLIKNCNNYQLKCCMIDILQNKLQNDNNDPCIASYISPKWFLNNVVLNDTKLVQKILIYCLNEQNYKDLYVTSLWSLLTNSSFCIKNSFLNQIIQIVINFSGNNSDVVNGCLQSILDAIFSIGNSVLQNNTSNYNITLFLLNVANRNLNGEINVDINKGLIQCCTSIPPNLILFKILISNHGLLDFNICKRKSLIQLINYRIKSIQNQSIKDMYYEWYEENITCTNNYNSISISNSNSDLSSPHSKDSLNGEKQDEQCLIM